MFKMRAQGMQSGFDSITVAARKRFMTSSKNRGFSLLELLIVIAIGLTMAGVTFMTLMPLFKENHVDAAYDTTLSVIRTYRNQSITQSKRYLLMFTPPGTITVQYWGVGVPVAPAPVTVATYTLPPDIQFAVQAGFPNPGPDGFGTGAAATTMNNCVLVTTQCMIFYPDGSAQDDAGNFNNAVVYLTRPTDMYSSRSVTVFGTTGRVRGWRLYKQSGVNTWVQQ
jgi:prepilin-type N-terminal cleavage/methylation domain-containing protein